MSIWKEISKPRLHPNYTSFEVIGLYSTKSKRSVITGDTENVNIISIQNAAKEITEWNVTNCVGPVPISPTALMWTEFVGPVVVPAIGTISAKKVWVFPLVVNLFYAFIHEQVFRFKIFCVIFLIKCSKHALLRRSNGLLIKLLNQYIF